MAYKQKKYIFRNAIEIEEYHTARYGAPGEKRREKKNPTQEQIAKMNQRNKEKRCRRKLRAHFSTNDYFTDLTYAKDARPPNMETAKKQFQKFMRIVRKEYQKRGAQLKWIRNIEVGKRNAWHIHLVINRIPDTDIILRKAWEHGRVVNELLYEKGEFRDLAAYLTKSPDTDQRLVQSSYWTSRNLPVPEPKEKIYNRWKTWKDEPYIPKGFFLDKDSYHEGINPITGFRYRSFTLLRTRREQDEWKRRKT